MATLVSRDFHFTLNGEPVGVSGVASQMTLLDFVRSRGLTGAKEGCAEGECGACAVLFVRAGVQGTCYQPVNSCLVPLPAAEGQEIVTVEALAEGGELAPVQSAMAAGGGSQCGYCTPGFVVSMFAEHHRREDRPADVHALSGNLCRCTGYRPIRDALESLAAPRDSVLKRRLDASAPKICPLRYESAEGRFSRPVDLAECFGLMAGDDAAQFVAGNTDLGVMTNLRGQRFPHLISLEGVAELREFREGAERVDIGAGLTLTEIAEAWRGGPDIFHEWLRLFASPLIRNVATLGGNLATASPIGDSAPMLMALNADVVIASARGERRVPLHEFFVDYRKTLLGRGEVLRSVRIPKPLPEHARFYKVAKRSADDISTVAAGIVFTGGQLRIGFGGVGPVPVRLAAAPDAMGALIRETLKPISDHRGSAEYRLAMAQSLVTKFRHEAGV